MLLRWTAVVIFVAASVIEKGSAGCSYVSTESGCRFFEANFATEGIEPDKWDFEISAYGGGNEEFQIYADDALLYDVVQSGTEQGLHIKPALLCNLTNPDTGQHYTYDFFKAGTLNMTARFGKCTESQNWGCYRNIGNIPPTAAVKLKGKNAFKYGKIEIRAKLPRGDWLWPALWLLPQDLTNYGGHPYCGEIDIAELRGNDDLSDSGGNAIGNSVVTHAYHFCKYYNSYVNYKHVPMTGNKNWTQDFHKYTVDWKEDSLTFLIDETVTWTITGPLDNYCTNPANLQWYNHALGPFDKPYIVLLNLGIGGRSNFFHPTFTPARPWINSGQFKQSTIDFYNAIDDWYPSWANSRMVIEYVRVSAEHGQDITKDGTVCSCPSK